MPPRALQPQDCTRGAAVSQMRSECDMYAASQVAGAFPAESVCVPRNVRLMNRGVRLSGKFGTVANYRIRWAAVPIYSLPLPC